MRTAPTPPSRRASSRRACRPRSRPRPRHRPRSRARARRRPRARGDRRHERVAVDLAVRMVDRRADLAAAVLEHEHVLDLGSCEQRFGARRPDVDDLAHVRGAEVASDCVWSGENSTTSHAPTAGTIMVPRLRPREVDRRARRERRPAVREPAHVVRIAALRGRRRRTGSRASGRFGRAWRWPTMLTHSRVSGSKRNSPCGPVMPQYLQDGANGMPDPGDDD